MRVSERFERLATIEAEPNAVEALRLGEGTMDDYRALARHHYRSGKPAVATRVLVLRHAAPTVVGRFLSRGDESAVVAVLVESMPTLSCRLRDAALRNRYGPWLDAAQRARLLNDEVRCISRVVVEPRWRGQGAAVRLVRHALATATTPVTEALAAMGRVTPFFEKAGMTAYRRPPHAHDARLSAALATIGLTPHDLAATRVVWRMIESLPEHRRTWLVRELERWHRASYGGYAPDGGDALRWLRAAGERLLVRPVYYVHVRDG